MTTPLSHVGQTARPEATQDQQQGDGQQQSQHSRPAGSASQAEPPEPGTAKSDPPATRLPNHPQQQQHDAANRADGQERIRQQSETRAEDTALPAPTDTD